MQLNKILVATDFSKPADLALERAMQLAQLAQAEIHLVHAYELPTTVGTLDVPLAPPQEFFDQFREASQRHLDQRAKKVSAAGFKAHAHLAMDTPARAILDVAAKVGADMIVVGTHGRTGMMHVLLGSVAERVVRLAPCAVLTVKTSQG